MRQSATDDGSACRWRAPFNVEDRWRLAIPLVPAGGGFSAFFWYTVNHGLLSSHLSRWWGFGCCSSSFWLEFWSLSAHFLLPICLSTIYAFKLTIMMSQNRAANYDRLQAEASFNVNMESGGNSLLHTKELTIWCNKIRRSRNLKVANRIVIVLIKWPNCVRDEPS